MVLVLVGVAQARWSSVKYQGVDAATCLTT
jgi:hypothetical protein